MWEVNMSEVASQLAPLKQGNFDLTPIRGPLGGTRYLKMILTKAVNLELHTCMHLNIREVQQLTNEMRGPESTFHAPYKVMIRVQ